MNTHDNIRTKKHDNLSRGESASSSYSPLQSVEHAPSSSRTTACKLSPIERLTINIKNKLGVNISTKESSRIINSIYAEEDSEQTTKSLEKAIERKKSKHPELNIGEKIALARAKKTERILKSGIEEQENKIIEEREILVNYPDIMNKLFKDIMYGMLGGKVTVTYFNELTHLETEVLGCDEDDFSYGLDRDKSALEKMVKRYDSVVEKMKLSDSQTLIEQERNLWGQISILVSKINKKIDRLNHLRLVKREFFIQFAKKNSSGKESRKKIEKYESLSREYPSLPRVIKAREQGIERLEEYKEIAVMAVENCEDVILMTEVRNALADANKALESVMEKDSELTDEINRDMQDAKIKQDAINAIIASSGKKKKDTDIEEQPLALPLVPKHALERSSNAESEKIPSHKSKPKRKAVLGALSH